MANHSQHQKRFGHKRLLRGASATAGVGGMFHVEPWVIAHSSFLHHGWARSTKFRKPSAESGDAAASHRHNYAGRGKMSRGTTPRSDLRWTPHHSSPDQVFHEEICRPSVRDIPWRSPTSGPERHGG